MKFIARLSTDKCKLDDFPPDDIVLEGDYNSIIDGLHNGLNHLCSAIPLTTKSEVYIFTFTVKRLKGDSKHVTF